MGNNIVNQRKCIDTIAIGTISMAGPTTWSEWLRAGLRLLTLDAVAILDTLSEWQQRANDRQCLRTMDDRMLSDIGLSRADVEREASKPFWRP